MLKVELTNKTENPFYGLRNCLDLFQNAGKGSVNELQLDRCWAEVQDSKEKREMFFSLLFSIGDITARNHNIFKNAKIDSGGNSQREAFHTVLKWLKRVHYPQFKKFLFKRLFNEYVSMDAILRNRVKTKNRKGGVLDYYTGLSGSEEYVNDLTDFAADIIKGKNPADKYFLAKFLTRPRVGKRQKRKKLLQETRIVMREREKFLQILSDKAGLRYEKKENHIEFHGYFEWRQQYNGELESVLFSSGKIREFDKDGFLNWLEKLPSGARFRVRRRLMDGKDVHKAKWGKMPEWFLDWEKAKETKQKEVRVLEEKIRQKGGASEDEKVELAKIKKEAKVTVGAVNFTDMMNEIITGRIDKIKIQPFLDKIKLEYNTLVFVDDSGSMFQSRGYAFTPFEFATFMATICLMKNPDDEGRSMIGLYSANARLYSTMSVRGKAANSLMRPTITQTSEPLIVPEDHFLDNLRRMREFVTAMKTGNSTNISSIPQKIYEQVKDDLTMKEMLQNFPVWTVISDGNFNNFGSAEASVNDFMMKCETYFGFRPFLIVIDVAKDSSARAEQFSGIPNFMFIPPNPAQIEQFLTNFKDIDIMDVYTPLQSLHRSNRYELVRKATI
jgi:hypothetical protein